MLVESISKPETKFTGIKEALKFLWITLWKDKQNIVKKFD